MKKSSNELVRFLAISALFSTAAFADTRSVSMTAVEIGGAKFWLPSTITVKKGDVVKIHAVSKVPGAKKGEISPHGLAIDDFKVSEVVDDKGKDFEFTADKAGIFPFRCQLHPAHQGGQLVVLE